MYVHISHCSFDLKYLWLKLKKNLATKISKPPKDNIMKENENECRTTKIKTVSDGKDYRLCLKFFQNFKRSQNQWIDA